MCRQYLATALLLIIPVGLWAAAGAHYARSQTPAEGKTVRVLRLKLKGVKSIPKRKVLRRMATKGPSLLRPWEKGPEFDEEVLKDDMVRIRKLYADHGFYDARATYELEYNERGDGVKITVKVREGKPVIVKKLTVSYAKKFDERLVRRIGRALPLRVNKPFSAIKYQKAKSVIKRILLDRGYPKARVRGEALVNRKERWAEVSYVVEPGELYRFGITQVTGNKTVRSEIITREVAYRKGEIYSETKLDTTQSNIYSLGLFSTVLIDTSLDDRRRVVNVKIRVKERKHSSIGIGVGYGTEDQFRAQLVWSNRNFLGRGGTVRNRLKFSFLTLRLENEYSQPFFVGRNSKFVVNLDLTRDDLPSFNSENLVGVAGVTKGFGRIYELAANYNVRLSKIFDVTEATKEFIDKNSYFLSFLNVSLTRTTADDVLNPTRGTVAQLLLETSLRTIGSDVDYLKAIVNLKGYRRLWSTVLAARLDLGVLQPLAGTDRVEVPIFTRFFAGGSTTVRGFGFQKLGPLDNNNEPIGGDTLIVGSLENRFPIYGKVGGTVFVDFGNVYTKEWDFRLDELKYAPGVGLRYDTIIGPIRLDFAYAINPDPRLGHFQFFFSIGQAF